MRVDARPFLTWAFVIGIARWVAASVVLAIPHGQGHSIESMTPFVVLRDAAFPVWIGAFVCILAGLPLGLGGRSTSGSGRWELP
jgi:hypothetical protein